MLQIVADEFKLLEHGVQLKDASRNDETFTCRAKLVQVRPWTLFRFNETFRTSHAQAYMQTRKGC